MNQNAITHDAVHNTACALCGSTNYVRLFKATDFDSGRTDFDVDRCVECGLVQTMPRLQGDALSAWYATEYYGQGEKKFTGIIESLIQFANHFRARQMLAKLPQTKKGQAPKVLDIGCGRGSLLRALSAQGCDAYGVEMADFPLDSLGEGIKLYKGALESLPLEAESFDLVIIWHALEHVEDPLGTLKSAARLLRSSGRLAIAVPNFSSWQAHLFGPRWFHLDVPRHLYHFTPKTLERGISQAGLRLESWNSWSLIQTPYGLLQSALNRLRPEKPNQLFRMLKGEQSLSIGELGWLAGGLLLMPIALGEFLVSGLFGRGACIVCYAAKPHPDDSALSG